MEKIFFDKNY